MSDDRPVTSPRELADPWYKLPVLCRGLGRELYHAYERRVIRVRLDEAEDVFVRMIGPKDRERKALRGHIRSMIDAQVLVAVEGGVRLLLWPEDWARFHGTSSPQNSAGKAPAKADGRSTDGDRKVDARSTEGDRMVDARSTEGDRMVDARSTEGDRMVDGRCTDGAPTPQDKPAESLDLDPRNLRERSERDRVPDTLTLSDRVSASAHPPARAHAPASAPARGAEPVLEGAPALAFDAPDFDPSLDQLDDAPDEVPLAQAVPGRFRALYRDRFQVDPATNGPSTYTFPERVDSTARMRKRTWNELLTWAFGQWADDGCAGTEKGVPPYAAFVARFDGIVSPPGSRRRGGFMRSRRRPEDFPPTEADEVLG